VVIKNGLHWSGNGDFACSGNPRMRMDREPHIGEYVAKTNAICDCSQIPPTPEAGR
jgi:hypothetical protein